MSPADRRARVDRDDPVLAIVAQCRLLKIARSTLYYRPAPVDPDDLAVMRRIDELYLAKVGEHPKVFAATEGQSWMCSVAASSRMAAKKVGTSIEFILGARGSF